MSGVILSTRELPEPFDSLREVEGEIETAAAHALDPSAIRIYRNADVLMPPVGNCVFDCFDRFEDQSVRVHSQRGHPVEQDANFHFPRPHEGRRFLGGAFSSNFNAECDPLSLGGVHQTGLNEQVVAHPGRARCFWKA